MNNTKLIARANAKAVYLDNKCWFNEAKLIRELVDALEAAQPVVSLQAAHDSVTIDSLNDRVMHLLREKAKLIETVDELRDELQEARETRKPPLKVHTSAGDYLRHKAATAAQPAGEPAAWQSTSLGESILTPEQKNGNYFCYSDEFLALHTIPLYARPAAQVPMTEKETDLLWDSFKDAPTMSYRYLVTRAIEAHFKIGAKP